MQLSRFFVTRSRSLQLSSFVQRGLEGASCCETAEAITRADQSVVHCCLTAGRFRIERSVEVARCTGEHVSLREAAGEQFPPAWLSGQF